MLRGALAAVLLLSGAATSNSGESALARSRNTTATYASYQWMIQRDGEGANGDGWAAEFHHGVWHRIENGFRHALANCRTGDAYVYELSTGESHHFQDKLNANCGITSAGGIESAVRLGGLSTKLFGRLDVFKVIDSERTRHYEVNNFGALIRVDWFPRDGSRYPCLIQQPVAIFSKLPFDDIFSVKSLISTVTPEEYRHRPSRVSNTGPSGKNCS